MRYVTQSEVSCFRECKRKWWLAWHRKIRFRAEYTTPSAASLGTLVHEALRAHYAGESWQAVVTALRAESEEIYKEHPESLVKAQAQGALAQIMLEGYVEWLEETGADSALEFLSQEEQISVDFPGLPVTLMGKLDARVRTLDIPGYGFLDFKTVQSLDEIPAMADLNEQFKHYSLIMRLTGDDRFTGGIWRMLRKVKRTANAKPPFYGEYRKLYNEQQMTSYVEQLRGTILAILSTEASLAKGHSHQSVVPPTPHRDCNWKCEFRTICPMFDDGSRVEDFISEYYETKDPLKDRYTLEESNSH